MPRPLEQTLDFVGKYWHVIVALVLGFSSLWYGQRLAEYRLDKLESRVALIEGTTDEKLKIVADRLRGVELQLAELKALLSGNPGRLP